MELINPRLEKSTKTGVFEVRWTERKDGVSRSRSLSLRTTDRVQAQSSFEAFIAGEEQSARAVKSPTVDDLVSRYRAFLASHRPNAETQNICLQHLTREIGAVRVTDISPERLRQYAQRRGVADSTLRRELQVLAAVINYAVKHKVLTLADKPVIELPRAGEARHVYLNAIEESEFHALAMGDSIGKARLTRLTRFIGIALDTAARASAIIGLTWDRVDLAGGYIDLREEGVAVHNKRRALVPISKRLRPMLERAWRERKSVYVLDNNGTLRYAWAAFMRENPQFAHIHPHDLRRTFATLAVQAGVPIVNVAQILGDDPTTVLRHYAHFVPGAAQDAVDRRFG